MTVGENIKSLRKKAKLTQVELAEKANMSRSYLADVERNRYNPSVDTLKSIATALNVSVSTLMRDEQDETNWDSRTPELTDKDERDIAKKLENIINELESDTSLAFNGEPMDDTTRELVLAQIESNLRLAKQLAKKKFTPKKYRK